MRSGNAWASRRSASTRSSTASSARRSAGVRRAADEVGGRGSGGLEQRGGQVDPAEPFAVVPQILQVVQDLQRAAERVAGRPAPGAFIVQVEQEPPDRVSGDARSKRPDQPSSGSPRPSASWRNATSSRAACATRASLPSGAEGGAQPERLRRAVPVAGQPRLEPSEPRELRQRSERGIVRHVVGGAREAIKGKDRRPKVGSDQQRADREVLLRVHRMLIRNPCTPTVVLPRVLRTSLVRPITKSNRTGSIRPDVDGATKEARQSPATLFPELWAAGSA